MTTIRSNAMESVTSKPITVTSEAIHEIFAAR